MNYGKVEAYLKAKTEEEREELLKDYTKEEKIKFLWNVKLIIANVMAEKQNMTCACYECVYRGNVPGDAHSCCNNGLAVAVGDEHGIKKGWFFHPYNFDPVWLRYCDGFKKKKEN